MQHEAVRLYVGGHAGSVCGEPLDLEGFRCFTAAHRPNRWPVTPAHVHGLLDSGAFTDPPARRLTPTTALARQLAWEDHAARLWGTPWRARALVSYDVLIDEVWAGGARTKRRWSVAAAEGAVAATIAAATYLAGQRAALAPRIPVLSVQGVDAIQYDECAAEVVKLARPGDWIGLGGWCILGRFTSWLPTFWQAIRRVLPRIAAAGVRHVHIFGVLWEPALGGLAWLADRHGLTVSTDSTAPLLAATRADPRKAGVRMPYWRDNVRWWQDTLAHLRESAWYREPPERVLTRQLALVEGWA